MKKPKPARAARPSGLEYPTLSEFARDRRTFLKRLALGAAAVGFAGPLSACLSQSQPDGEDAVRLGEPDTFAAGPGDTAQGPSDAGVDGTQPDTFMEEMPSPGGMPMPELFSVRLPATGSTSSYVALDGYLIWSLTFQTYDYALQSALLADEHSALVVCGAALSPYSCEEISAAPWPLSSGEIHDAVLAALRAHSVEIMGWEATIENLTLNIDSCEEYGPIEGDMIDPNYP